MLEEQAANVREEIIVLNELIETDCRTVPTFDSSMLPDVFDSIETDVNIFYVSIPVKDLDDNYIGHEEEIAEYQKLVSDAERLLAIARKKYSLEN